MLVTETSSSGPYVGNGAASVFSYGFKIFDASHLLVTHTGADGVSTVLTQDDATGRGYALVTGVGNTAGGTISYTIDDVVSALPAGEELLIERLVEYVQETNFQQPGGLDAESIETSFDYLTMQTQQLARQLEDLEATVEEIIGEIGGEIITGELTAGYIPVATGSATLTDSGLYYDSATGNLGLGAPTAFVSTADAYSFTIDREVIQNRRLMRQFSADNQPPVDVYLKGRGTRTTPGAVLANDILFAQDAGGYTGSGQSVFVGAVMRCIALTGVSGGRFQTAWKWYTSDGTADPAVRMWLMPDELLLDNVPLRTFNGGVEVQSSSDTYIQMFRAANGTNAPVIQLRKARGTFETSFAAVQANDQLGVVQFEGRSSVPNNIVAAQYMGRVDTAPSGDIITGRHEWYTRDSGDTLALRMALDSDGTLALDGQDIVTNGSVNLAALELTGAANNMFLGIVAGVPTWQYINVVIDLSDPAQVTGVLDSANIDQSLSIASLAVSGNATIGGTLGVTGVATFSANPVITNTAPGWSLVETGAPADEGRWSFYANGGDFFLDMLNDALAATNLLTVTRTGSAPTGVIFNSPLAAQNLTLGADDVSAGSITVYGNNDATGALIDLYNAANEDANTERWRIEANDYLRIGSTGRTEAFQINPSTGNVGLSALNSWLSVTDGHALVIDRDTVQNRIAYRGFSDDAEPPVTQYLKGRGTRGAPAAIQSSDIMGADDYGGLVTTTADGDVSIYHMAIGMRYDCITAPSGGTFGGRVRWLISDAAGTITERMVLAYNALTVSVAATMASTLAVTGATTLTGPLITPRGGIVIASGSITPTGTYHNLDTEASAATDDLDNITAGSAGQHLYIRTTNSSRDVVVRHNGGGTGNIRNASGADITLTDNLSILHYIYDAVLALWLQVADA